MGGFMQLQIECNSAPFQQQFCLTCSHFFEAVEAKIIVCDDQGTPYGEVCPHCLRKGFHWLSDRVGLWGQPTGTTMRETVKPPEIEKAMVQCATPSPSRAA